MAYFEISYWVGQDGNYRVKGYAVDLQAKFTIESSVGEFKCRIRKMGTYYKEGELYITFDFYLDSDEEPFHVPRWHISVTLNDLLNDHFVRPKHNDLGVESTYQYEIPDFIIEQFVSVYDEIGCRVFGEVAEELST